MIFVPKNQMLHRLFSQKLPVTSIRQLNKLAKNVSSVSKDDSLTSLDWLSCLGTPQPSVKEPRPAQYTPKELIRLSFRLARHDVSKLKKVAQNYHTTYADDFLPKQILTEVQYLRDFQESRWSCCFSKNYNQKISLCFQKKNVFFWRAWKIFETQLR